MNVIYERTTVELTILQNVALFRLFESWVMETFLFVSTDTRFCAFIVKDFLLNLGVLLNTNSVSFNAHAWRDTFLKIDTPVLLTELVENETHLFTQIAPPLLFSHVIAN